MRLHFTISTLLCFVFLPAFFVHGEKHYKVMFYNVENFFDTENDPVKLDDDFTPEGYYCWTIDKYRKKLADVAEVINAVGKGELPEIVGLCEVENETVLNDLIDTLEDGNLYAYLHQDSPDERGIDVALLYRKDRFELLQHRFFVVVDSKRQDFTSRDILYASGKVPTGDTLHVFVNHWPSRRNGPKASERNRLLAASVLKSKIDSVRAHCGNALIVVMGDLNDTPVDVSVAAILEANRLNDSVTVNNNLYNLYYNIHLSGNIGTLKDGSKWSVFDQVIVSGGLLDKTASFYTTSDRVYIFTPGFLKEYNNSKTGFNPFRTYSNSQKKGPVYKGGMSDHFPVYVEFIMNNIE